MTTATRTTKAATITRTISLGYRSDLSVYGVVTEMAKGKTTQSFYTLRRIPSDMGGIGVEVTKNYSQGEVYHVHIGEHGAECDCPGGTYKGQCRHGAMVLQAINEAKL